MPERSLAVEERFGTSLDVTMLVFLSHGEDLRGRNVHTVWKKDLCAGTCEWCEVLVQRCQSRGGGVCWEDVNDHVVANAGGSNGDA